MCIVWAPCKLVITMVIVFVPWGFGTPSKWPKFMACKARVILTTYDTWEPILQVQANGFFQVPHVLPWQSLGACLFTGQDVGGSYKETSRDVQRHETRKLHMGSYDYKK